MRILFFGDSITQGFWSSEGGWVELIRKHYDGLALQDLKHNKQPEIFNLGISGDTTRNLLERIELETKVRKWPNDPLIVVVCIGTNDDLFENGQQYTTAQEFEKNLGKIIEILQPISDGQILVGNSACDESKTTPITKDNYVKAGDVVATAVGFKNTANYSFDLGVYDYRDLNSAAKNNAITKNNLPDLSQSGYALCWLDMFESVDYRTYPAVDGKMGKTSDYCK